MARIRTVKPEFWTDERVGECSISARLLLIASLNFADDYGGLERSSKQLKAQAFPYDAIDCEPLVLELIRQGLFIEYEVANRKYLHIKGFSKHQRVENKAQPRIPKYEESMSVRPTLTEASPSPHRELTETTPRSYGLLGKGREGNGSRKGSQNTTAAAQPTFPSEFTEIKALYPPRGGDNPWPRALKACLARIRDGCTWTDLTEGTRRYQVFCRETAKIGTEFVMQAATFFGPDKRFTEPWDIPATRTEIQRDQNMEASRAWLNASN